MRILFADENIYTAQQNFFRYTRHYRDIGVDAHLLYNTNFKVLPFYQQARKTVFEEMQRHPACKGMEFPSPFLLLKRPRTYREQMRDLKQHMRGFDIIVCSGISPLWVRWAGRPFIYFSYGADLDMVAIHGRKIGAERSMTPGERFKTVLLRYYLRDSLRKARSAVIAPYQIPTAHRLGLRRLKFFNHAIDVEFFRPMESGARAAERAALRERLGCDLVFFHPPRHLWVEPRTPNRKANDRLFRAFARFRGQTKKRAKLLTIEWGPDAPASRKFLQENGLEEDVVWLKFVEPAEVVRYYNAADAVLDHFASGILDLVAVEALACGAPVVSYVAPAPPGMFYAEMPPVIQASTEEEILRCLHEVAENPGIRERTGAASREWAVRNCDWRTSLRQHLEFYREVVEAG